MPASKSTSCNLKTKNEKGLWAEKKVISDFERRGHQLIFHRLKHRICEIDLIFYSAKKGWEIVEVKFGSPEVFLQRQNKSQLQRLERFFNYFLSLTPQPVKLHFAVVSQLGEIGFFAAEEVFDI